MPGELCVVCSKDGAKRCAGCGAQFYCSRECQKKDWKIHKKICRQASDIAASRVDPGGIEEGIFPSGKSKEAFSNMISTMAAMGLSRCVPKFHEEYKSLYPREKHNYKALRDIWMMTIRLYGDQIIEKNREFDERYLLKRWHCRGPGLNRFLASQPQPGAIFEDQIIHPFGFIKLYPGQNTKIYQTMRNTPVPSAEFEFGQTYVSVGAVDMFQLVIGSFTEASASSATSSDTELFKPLKFFSFDCSEIVTARSLILYEMMLQGCASQSILQVWFSTGWNDHTLKDFESTCKILIDEKGSQLDEKVKKLVVHWMGTKMKMSTGLPLWRQHVKESTLDPLNNLSQKQDRMDYARYTFTGQIFGRDDKDYPHGNVTMFSLPSGYDHYQRDTESVYAALSLKNFPYSSSLMSSMIKMIHKGLDALAENIRNGKIICSFRVEFVDLDNIAAIKKIRDLNAKVIDWSNLGDYMSDDAFYGMAKACGQPGTTHTLHYMNWMGRVFGTSLIDYPNKAEIYKVLKRDMTRRYDILKKSRPYLGQDKYLMYFMNVADKMLCNRYRQHFVDYVTKGRKISVGELTSEEWNPFERSNSCFYMSFLFK